MRTTLTLDDDVAKLIEEEVHRARKPFKQVVNEALRRGLAPKASARRTVPFRVRPHAAKLLPGLDRSRFNALADELEDYTVVAKLGRPGAKASRASERKTK